MPSRSGVRETQRLDEIDNNDNDDILITHSSSGVGTNNLRSDQDRMMQEQEEGLDLLGNIIRWGVKT